MISSLERIDRALSSRQTLRASYDVARLAIEQGVPGDFVECGVFAGAQCAAMALAIMDPAHYYAENKRTAEAIKWPWPPRRVHLFDSFEGIPEAGEHDTDFKRGGHAPGTSCCTLEQVQFHMREWGIPDELLVYRPGFFADTVRRLAFPKLEQIAVLRLDGDLYESTKVCLEYLYPLLSPGGWCIVDDFHLDGCRKAVMEYFDSSAPGPIYWQKS